MVYRPFRVQGGTRVALAVELRLRRLTSVRHQPQVGRGAPDAIELDHLRSAKQHTGVFNKYIIYSQCTGFLQIY